MSIFVVVGLLLIYYIIFNLSPVRQVINDVKSRYVSFEYHSKTKVKDKNVYVIHDRLIFEIDIEIDGVTYTSKVTPKDFNGVETNDTVYVILNSQKTEICDISKSEEELFTKLDILERYPFSIMIEELEGVQDV